MKIHIFQFNPKTECLLILSDMPSKGAAIEFINKLRCFGDDFKMFHSTPSDGVLHIVKLEEIKDVTPIPHNGCRPPKRRRV